MYGGPLIIYTAMKSFKKSFMVVVLGVLLSLFIALLTVFGILAPLLTVFMGSGRFGLEIGGPTTVPTALLLLAAAFSFYWGGMFSSSQAPARHRLHGTLVAPAAFLISPFINLISGNGLFPGVDTTGAYLLMLAILLVSIAGAYVGARRGEALNAHNRKVRRQRRLRQRPKKPVANELERPG